LIATELDVSSISDVTLASASDILGAGLGGVSSVSAVPTPTPPPPRLRALDGDAGGSSGAGCVSTFEARCCDDSTLEQWPMSRDSATRRRVPGSKHSPRPGGSTLQHASQRCTLN
jgi:hypothetical protein